jgi:hypothetical protein
MPPSKVAEYIDQTMELASRALVETHYFEAEDLCLRALSKAFATKDYERMARVLLPLQEARRQKRQLATDSGLAFLMSALPDAADLMPGCYLFQPPVIGIEVRPLRQAADKREIPTLILTREPLTRSGRWPVVSVGVVSVRAQVDPPYPVQRVETSKTKDDAIAPPPVEWFMAAAEAIGDAAIAKLVPTEPAAWRVVELMEFLDAFPEHEKMHQRLADACREAQSAPPPERARPRRRPGGEAQFSF